MFFCHFLEAALKTLDPIKHFLWFLHGWTMLLLILNYWGLGHRYGHEKVAQVELLFFRFILTTEEVNVEEFCDRAVAINESIHIDPVLAPAAFHGPWYWWCLCTLVFSSKHRRVWAEKDHADLVCFRVCPFWKLRVAIGRCSSKNLHYLLCQSLFVIHPLHVITYCVRDLIS